MQDEKENNLPYFALTREILSCCFEVMKELGSGFLERVYKNALFLVMKDKGLNIEVEKHYEVLFRNKVIGRYSADLVVEKTVIVELKCCDCLLREHQAQLFNYLTVSQLPVGLLINFQRRKLEYKRLHRREEFALDEEEVEEPIPL
jgi:GxxExxY protein